MSTGRPEDDEVELHAMSAEEIQDVLLKTGLHIVFAANQRPGGGTLIQAAHGDPHSYIIIRGGEAGTPTEEWSGIRMTGGSRDERRARYQHMLAGFEADGLGKPHAPDGRPLSFFK